MGTEWRNALLQGIFWVESWETQTKPESSKSIWRALWNHFLWEVPERSAGIGQLNEPRVITGQEREKDVTGVAVPGFSLDTTEVVLMHHINCGQATPQQRWQTQVWSRGYLPCFHPFLSFLWLCMGHWYALPIFGHVCNKNIRHIYLSRWFVLELNVKINKKNHNCMTGIERCTQWRWITLPFLDAPF